MEEKPQWPETTLAFVRRIREFGDIYTYVFRPVNPVSYIAGQYGHLRLAGMPEGVRSVREFSFVSAPHEADIVFGVDSSSRSDYQQTLSALKEGDTVTLFKIKNHMTWPPTTQNAVMIAGGVGITPFISMLRDRAHRSLPVKATLLHVARADYLYREEATRLADAYIPLTRSNFLEGLARATAFKPDAHYYIAGSPSFVEGVGKLLVEHGITTYESDPFKGLEDF